MDDIAVELTVEQATMPRLLAWLSLIPRQRCQRLVATIAGIVATTGWALVPHIALAASRSPFTPASPQAADIRSLFWFVIVAAGVIFVVVEGALIYSAFAHRDRPGRVAAQFSGNTRLEIAWTALPAILLAVVFVLTVRTMQQVGTPNGATDPLVIHVVGHQFWWEFDYTNPKIVTANELHVPVGQPIVLEVTSADVIHSFWVPSISGKTDANPGMVNTLYITVDKPGTYLGQCAEFCGAGHTWMEIRVIAQTPVAYQAWVRDQEKPAATPSGGLAAQGEQVFMSQTCKSCHTIDGTSAKGIVGPNLTHIGSRETIGAGVLTNTPTNMALWLKNPQAVKPGARMPNFNLTPGQVKVLTAYLESLR